MVVRVNLIIYITYFYSKFATSINIKLIKIFNFISLIYLIYTLAFT